MRKSGKQRAVGKVAVRAARRSLAITLAAAFCCTTWFAGGLRADAASAADLQGDLLDVIQDVCGYEEYLAEHEGAAHPDTEIVVKGTDYLEASEGFYKENDGLCTLEDGSVTYEVDVPLAGFYSICLDYYPVEGKNSSIERELYINGEIPFENAQYLKFSRIWQNAEKITRDSRDNDVRPKQAEAGRWMQTFLKDSDGYYQDAFDFYFEKGKNTITLTSTKEPMKIGGITLTQEKGLPGYAEYQAGHQNAGHKAASCEAITVQGEAAVYKSDSTLYPIADRSSPLTEPYSPSKTRLNVVGGSNWKQVGQWISWEIEVPEDGMYEIAVRYRQNINTGVTVVRSVALDGQIPFAEARECKFYYGRLLLWAWTRLPSSFI